MTLKMKAEIKQQWIDALRSGEYQQGSGDLHTMYPTSDGGVVERFCCLGILSLMCEKAGAVTSNEGERIGHQVAYGSTSETAYLPHEVVAWAGLEYEGRREYTKSKSEEIKGVLTTGTREETYRDGVSLSVMNDTGHSFEEIAQVIEDQVVGV